MKSSVFVFRALLLLYINALFKRNYNYIKFYKSHKTVGLLLYIDSTLLNSGRINTKNYIILYLGVRARSFVFKKRGQSLSLPLSCWLNFFSTVLLRRVELIWSVALSISCCAPVVYI